MYQIDLKVYTQWVMVAVGYPQQLKWTQRPYKQYFCRQVIYCYTDSLTEYTVHIKKLSVNNKFMLLKE